jgi:peptidyl-prolyl cis-trans isomerase SurA
MKLRTLIALVAVSWPAARVAQAQGFSEIDHVVAVVGRVAIPYSRVEEEINLMRARGETLPTDSSALMQLKEAIVNRLVDDELMYEAAKSDTSIHVTDEQVQHAVDDAIRKIRLQFHSDVDFERQLTTSGFGSQEEYRRWITDQQRRDLLQQALVQKLQQKGDMKPVPPTEAEMRAFYDKVKGQQTRPSVVSFRQIVIRPTPDSSAIVRALQLADSLYVAIKGGADFCAVAKRFSDDPGTKDECGELGYFRRGFMVPEFDRAAFSLKPGQLSLPVQTSFGFHLIEVERSDPTEVEARHILIKPVVTDANVAAAQRLIDSVATLAHRGASFDSLARLYHDPSQQSFAEGIVLDSLPLPYREVFDTSQAGAVVGPITLPQPDSSVRYAVIRLEQKRAAGQYTYDELKDRIRQQLSAEAAERRYLDDLRSKTYVDIRLTP